MITREKWIEFLRTKYNSLDLQNDTDFAVFCMLATVEQFLKSNEEI